MTRTLVYPIILPAVLSLVAPLPAKAGIEDIDAKLAQARRQYEEDLSKIRDDAIKALDRAEAQLRTKPDPDLAAIGRLKAERDAFIASGDWPSIPAMNLLADRANQARRRLLSAYTAAKSGCIKEKYDDLAAALESERKALEQESDLVPWGPEIGSPAPRSITSEKVTVDAGAGPVQSYRLQVIGKRLSGDGPLWIAVPLAEGKRIELECQPDASGKLHVLLSARGSSASPELGLSRPAPAPTGAERAGELALWAPKGEFEVASIRIKPILPAKAAPIAEKPAPTKRSTPVRGKQPPRGADAATQLTRDSKWSGTHQQDDQTRQTTVVVTKRNDDHVEIRTPRIGGNAHMLLVFQIKGDQLGLVSSTPQGHPGAVFDQVTGGGSLDGDRLQIQYSWFVQPVGKGGRRGDLVKGSFDLTRE